MAAFVFVRGGGEVPPAAPAPGTEVTATSPLPAPAESGDGALAGLQAKVDSVHAALRSLDAKLDAALAARSPAEGPADLRPVTVDAAMLQQALIEAEAKVKRDKLAAMKPGEVIQAAADLTNSRKDLGAAREMLEALLQRSLTPEERQKALTHLGITHRASGDLTQSKQVLQGAVDFAGGADTQAGAWAAFQLAWTHQSGNDLASARQAFEQVGRSAGGGVWLRLEGRWNAAKLGEQSDPRVRAEFEALLRECGDDANVRHIADDVKARLDRR